MSTHLNFSTTKSQEFRDMGGDHVAVYAGRCRRCGRNVYAVRDVTGGLVSVMGDPYEPDPRGRIGPRHALSTLEAAQFDMTGNDVPFCWDCVCEQGSEGYQACLAIARKSWKPTPQAAYS